MTFTQITSDKTGIVKMSTKEPEEKLPISALKVEVKESYLLTLFYNWKILSEIKTIIINQMN